MKVFLINRSDVLFFSGETKLKVKKENGREFIDAPVLQDGKIVLRIIFCGSSVNPNFPIRIGGFILHSSGLSEYWACLLPDIPALIMRWIAMSFWTAGKRRIFGFGLTTLSTKSQVFP